MVRPHRSVEGAGELAQDDVAHLVAELVVDQLQVVHVDHGDGELLAGSLGPLQLLLEPLVEEAAVLELRQVVAGCDVVELCLAVQEDGGRPVTLPLHHALRPAQPQLPSHDDAGEEQPHGPPDQPAALDDVQGHEEGQRAGDRYRAGQPEHEERAPNWARVALLVCRHYFAGGARLHPSIPVARDRPCPCRRFRRA